MEQTETVAQDIIWGGIFKKIKEVKGKEAKVEERKCVHMSRKTEQRMEAAINE